MFDCSTPTTVPDKTSHYSRIYQSRKGKIYDNQLKNWKRVRRSSHVLQRNQRWIYEGRLQSSWTHLITPSRNFVEVRWRSLFRSTSLGKQCISYNAPPTSRKRASDRWSLRNLLPRSSLFMVGKAQKSHGVRLGPYGGCSSGVPPIHFFQVEHRIQFRSRPMRFLGFSNHEKGATRQEISKWSTVCSTFSWNGWRVVRSESLAKGGTSKKRPSPHLHKVPTRSNKMSPGTSQTALVYTNILRVKRINSTLRYLI
jgi:hypothetical protein